MAKTLKSTQVCHKFIKETAREFAGAFYDAAARDDVFYKYYPSEKGFIAREWGRFVPHARSILAQMLARSDVSEHEKSTIHEALQLDRTLPQSQRHGLEAVN